MGQSGVGTWIYPWEWLPTEKIKGQGPHDRGSAGAPTSTCLACRSRSMLRGCKLRDDAPGGAGPGFGFWGLGLRAVQPWLTTQQAKQPGPDGCACRHTIMDSL